MLVPHKQILIALSLAHAVAGEYVYFFQHIMCLTFMTYFVANWVYLATFADVVYDTDIIDALLVTLVHLFRYGIGSFGVKLVQCGGRGL